MGILGFLTRKTSKNEDKKKLDRKEKSQNKLIDHLLTAEEPRIHNSVVIVKSSEEDKKLMISMAESAEKKENLEEALYYYKMAKDEKNRKRIENLLEGIENEKLKNKHDLLVTKAENYEKNGDYLSALNNYKEAKDSTGRNRVERKIEKIRGEEIKKDREHAIANKNEDFLHYAEVVVGSTWQHNAGLNEIRLNDYRRAINILGDIKSINLLVELWIKQAEKDANEYKFDVAVEDYRNAFNLTKDKKEKETLKERISIMESKAKLKEKLNKTF